MDASHEKAKHTVNQNLKAGNLHTLKHRLIANQDWRDLSGWEKMKTF